MKPILLCALALAACAPVPKSDLADLLTSNDLRLETNGESRATLQLFNTGRGSAEFASNPGFPVDFDWTLRGSRFCIQSPAMVSAFGNTCAGVTQTGNTLTFSDMINSTVISTATLVPR